MTARERETRTLEYQGTVRMLALRLKNRLPPSIELDDCIQAGMIAVWTAAPDLRRSWMRKRIWWAMIDSFKGKEYREATRPPLEFPSHSQDEGVRPADPADRRDNVEQIAHANEESIRARAAQRAQSARLQRAMADPDPLYHPLTRREKRVITLRYSDTGMTQQATARRLHLSQTRISQLQARAIGKLKLKMAA